MISRQVLLKEIESLPSDYINEVYHYISFLKLFGSSNEPADILLASEQSLTKEWLLPEEDTAWADL